MQLAAVKQDGFAIECILDRSRFIEIAQALNLKTNLT
jgi:hypothetical protein